MLSRSFLPAACCLRIHVPDFCSCRPLFVLRAFEFQSSLVADFAFRISFGFSVRSCNFLSFFIVLEKLVFQYFLEQFRCFFSKHSGIFLGQLSDSNELKQKNVASATRKTKKQNRRPRYSTNLTPPSKDIREQTRLNNTSRHYTAADQSNKKKRKEHNNPSPVPHSYFSGFVSCFPSRISFLLFFSFLFRVFNNGRAHDCHHVGRDRDRATGCVHGYDRANCPDRDRAPGSDHDRSCGPCTGPASGRVPVSSARSRCVHAARQFPDRGTIPWLWLPFRSSRSTQTRSLWTCRSGDQTLASPTRCGRTWRRCLPADLWSYRC